MINEFTLFLTVLLNLKTLFKFNDFYECNVNNWLTNKESFYYAQYTKYKSALELNKIIAIDTKRLWHVTARW